MSALIQKELRTYWNSPIAYIFIITFVGVSVWLFFRGFFLVGQNDMRSFFSLLPWLLLFLIPALTMRLWSEEYKQGTIETLMTSSLSLKNIILGKYFASLFFFLIVLGSTIILPISLSFIGPLDWGTVLVSYLGVALLGASLLALGLFISALSNNQIVSFIVSLLISFVLIIIGEGLVINFVPGFMAPILRFIGITSHYESITRGVIDSRDIIYYLSFIALCLFLNKQSLLARK